VHTVARLVTGHGRLVLLSVVAISVLLSVKLPLGFAADVVRFLPADDPEVKAFERISRGGSLTAAVASSSSCRSSNSYPSGRTPLPVSNLPLRVAHDTGDRVVDRIRVAFPEAEVTVHHDPDDEHHRAQVQRNETPPAPAG